ncbi:excisionase family DNA-binding protein [Corynebacterium singulare]|uniref:Transcriptional regulator, AlpA family n=1 Tax=Corynebacterium singulare TaxID=161899 RepID=A0A0B6F4I6_9CORY|nr:excisionase family DNA-binding protein [Corynebacterium singulare]AJI80074.1 transcriptional regulator, AlpA family [Corynebacterium singulare]
MNEAQNHRPHVTLPPQNLEAMRDVSRFLEQQSGPTALVGPDGQAVNLPGEVLRALSDVAREMRQGKAITVAPVDQLLTTQEAADVLGISRPTLVKKLEDGSIAFERTTGGKHRRVRLVDVLRYRDGQRAERRKALRELVSEAQRVGAYDAGTDDVGAEDIALSLKDARKEAAKKERRG